MVLESEHVHPRGLSFASQRRVILLRDTQKLSWEAIAELVVNKKREQPCWNHAVFITSAMICSASRIAV